MYWSGTSALLLSEALLMFALRGVLRNMCVYNFSEYILSRLFVKNKCFRRARYMNYY